MKQEFENYIIETDGNQVRVTISNSWRNWLDYVFAIIPVLGAVLLITILIITFLRDEFKWYHLWMPLVLIGGFVFSFKNFLRTVFRPTGELLKVNKDKNTIQIKDTSGALESISLFDIHGFEYACYEESSSGEYPKLFCYVQVLLVIKGGRRIEFMMINPTEIIDSGYSQMQDKLIKRSKKMVKLLSKEIDILSDWKGVIRKNS